MTKVLILEDEALAARRLDKLLRQLAPEMQILGTVDSVIAARQFVQEHGIPDLLVSDIELADGLSFEFLEELRPPFQVIFTTAYDQYAIRAFKSRGLDYLLKPIDEEELRVALDRYRESRPTLQIEQLQALASALKAPKQTALKDRFLVKVGTKLRSVPVEDIHGFISHTKATWLLTNQQKSYDIDAPLDVIESQVDEKRFFRINRKCLVAHDALQEITAYSGSRLKVSVAGWEEHDLIVSRERVQEFKAWLG